jgi:NADPH-dependent F420 reductase
VGNIFVVTEKGGAAMRIAILGGGTVGMALARGFLRDGHEVMVGTRDTASDVASAWDATSDDARISDYRNAALFGEIVIPAVPGRLVAEIIDSIGADAFVGKIVIDPSNPVLMTEHGPEAAYPPDDSAAEHIQRLLPDARVVKAFNQIPAAQMTQPEASRGQPLVRICGDDVDAKAVVTEILERFGWRVKDLGPLSESRRLEAGLVRALKRQAES